VRTWLSGPTSSAGAEAAAGQLQVDFLHRLLSARTVTAAAQAAVETVREAVSSDVSWCGIRSGDVLTLAAYIGLRTTEMPALWCLKIGQGIGGRVAAQGRTIATRDYRHDPRRAPVMKRLIDNEGIRSGICAPLMSGADVLGVLYASHRAPRDWTGDEIRLVTDAARDTGSALGLLREQHGDRQRADEAEQRARAAVRDLEIVHATAADLARTEDSGAGIAVLAHHLGMHVSLFSPGGEVLRESSQGTPPEDQTRMFVSVGDEPLGALRVCGRRELTQAERGLVELCSHLIALQLLRERAALQSELRAHSEFLDDLIEDRLNDRRGILAHAALLGVDLRAPHLMACIGLKAPRDADAQAAVTRRTLTRLEQAIRRQQPGSIVVPRNGDVVVLLATLGAEPGEIHRSIRSVIQASTGHADQLAGGLGRICTGLDDYADSYAEACAALDLARRQPRAGQVLSSADLGFYELLARGSARHSLESMVEHALGAIIDADAKGKTEYLRTLDAYLASDRHLEQAAGVLHVHPNTVRYRLAKVQEIFGVNLHDVDARFLLELALRARGALQRP
jgi:sugar diacid utilization regulator/putative methionine-R-sulfoxide reductase with GAF domain